VIWLHSTLVFLHVLVTSVWIGAALWVAGDVRRALALGRPHSDALAARVRPALGLDAAAGIATVVTGGLLVWEEAVGVRLGITIGFVLTLARLGVLASMRRAFRDLVVRLGAGEAVQPSDASARRIAMLSGVAHTLWLVALATMVFPV
jgi:hypothetical protein